MAPVSSFADICNLLSVLSPREEEVLLLRLEALKCREIAEQLGISATLSTPFWPAHYETRRSDGATGE